MYNYEPFKFTPKFSNQEYNLPFKPFLLEYSTGFRVFNEIYTFNFPIATTILAELNKHRKSSHTEKDFENLGKSKITDEVFDFATNTKEFNMNAVSSRAVPFDIMVDYVNKNPRIPLFTEAGKGMSGNFVSAEKAKELTDFHLQLKDYVIDQISKVSEKHKIHKQNLSDYLKPFMFTSVILTVNRKGLENLLMQRNNEAAHPEFWAIAQLIAEIVKNIPSLKPNDYKNQFLNNENLDVDVAHTHLPFRKYIDETFPNCSIMRKMVISASMIARTSFAQTNEFNTEKQHLDRIRRLLVRPDAHYSIAEHCAFTTQHPILEKVFDSETLNQAKHSGFNSSRNLLTKNWVSLRDILTYSHLPVEEILFNL